MSTALTFAPAEATNLLEIAKQRRTDYLDEIGQRDYHGQAFAVGSIEGEAAFALAVEADNALVTVHSCQSALLLRLGLEGNGLTLEQTRLRGWIVGLLGSLAASLDQEDAA